MPQPLCEHQTAGVDRRKTSRWMRFPRHSALHQQTGEKAVLQVFVGIERNWYATNDNAMTVGAEKCYQPIMWLTRPRSWQSRQCYPKMRSNDRCRIFGTSPDIAWAALRASPISGINCAFWLTDGKCCFADRWASPPTTRLRQHQAASINSITGTAACLSGLQREKPRNAKPPKPTKPSICTLMACFLSLRRK